jgi:tripartite-type tricarboxylate transporter receptor subunit TctC
MRAKLLVVASIVLACLALASPAKAQSYPSRTVTLVVPFPAGSTTDNVARKLAEYVRAATGAVVVVDNKPGADGNLAAQTVLRAEPDGYTVFVTTNSTHAANINIFKELPFDPIKDFEMIGGVMTIPMVLTVKPEFPANDVAEFVAEAKKRAKPLFFASGNTSTRGAAELFKARYGIKMEHVPYRGSPQVVADLLGGQFDCAFIDALSSGNLIREGKLKGLAITSDKRLPDLPNIPTVAEGLPGFELGAWVGVVVRAKTPPGVVARLSGLVQSFAKDPAFVSYLTSIGSTPLQMDATQFRSYVESETKKWAEIVEVGQIEKK